VPEGLLHDGQVYVARNPGESERVLEARRMPPILWQARPFDNGLEHAEELRTVNPPAFLREENEIAGVAPFGEPGTQDTPLGEKWLPWMIGKRLRRGKSALESANRNLPILQIQVRQPQLANFAGTPRGGRKG